MRKDITGRSIKQVMSDEEFLNYQKEMAVKLRVEMKERIQEYLKYNPLTPEESFEFNLWNIAEAKTGPKRKLDL